MLIQFPPPTNHVDARQLSLLTTQSLRADDEALQNAVCLIYVDGIVYYLLTPFPNLC